MSAQQLMKKLRSVPNFSAARGECGSFDRVDPYPAARSVAAPMSHTKKIDTFPRDTNYQGALSQSFSQGSDRECEASLSRTRIDLSKSGSVKRPPSILRESKLVDAMKILLDEGAITWGAYSIAGRFKSPAPWQGRETLEQQKPFANWLADGRVFPYRMNCWEVVLYAAFRAELIEKDSIRSLISTAVIGANENENVLHNTTGSVKFIKMILENERTTQKVPRSSQYFTRAECAGFDIPSGYVIIFGSAGEHVALSLGGQRLIELDKKSGKDGVGKIVESTLSAVLENNSAYSRQLSWGLFPEMPTDN